MKNERIGDRAGGVLLGMGVADGWSTATEVALCVGDAAATGLALTDAGALDLLGRNLRELRFERHDSAGGLNSNGAIFAASAVVALAHVHDTRAKRSDAVRAVIAIVDEHTVVDDDVLRWAELVADTVKGALPDSGAESGQGTRAGHIHAAVQAVRVAEHTNGTDTVRFAAGLASVASAPAMAGALLGARFGWRAVPHELADQARGWPGAGSKALVGLGLLATRVQARSAVPASGNAERSGGTVPIERWDESSENALSAIIPAADDDGGGESSYRWRRSQVVLTTADADTTTEQGNDRRAEA